MGRRILLPIASGWLLLTCCVVDWSRGEDAPLGPQSSTQKVAFEDTAVATLNHKVDAAAQAAPASESPPPATASATTEAQPSDSAVGDVPPETTADRKSRLAALKARLHQHMGAEADPPAEEPAPPPPAGPMIGLRQPPCLQNMGISISGWVQQGITLNDDHPANGFNGPVDTNDLDREYQMNQFWMTMERPVNTGGNGFDFGGRIDAAYGTDWRWYMNNGLENRINGPDGQTYGLMLPQAYAAVGYNDLTVKLGTFQAILDYESLPAPANFFYSHSYCYTYGVPHLVTGMLADYKMDQNWSVQGGFHRGWSPYVDDNQALDFLGGFRWQSSDRRTIVSYTLSSGQQDISTAENGFVYSFVVQEKLGPRSEYVLVHDLGVENNALPGGGTADWYGLNQYYIYTLSSQWAACVRAEWFRDQDGVAVVGPGNVPGVRAWAGHGFAGNFYELTAGLNWRPQANVIFRPEVRYDWYDGGAGGYGLSNQTGLPFNDGRSSSQFLTAADLILMF
ncbi:MAG: outer membrane beta-barrel protein [Thermoguttaceae bacterium]